MKKYIFSALLIPMIMSCNSNANKSDAFGNFEATETLISSEVAGKITQLNVEEGMEIKAGTVAAVIDSLQTVLSIAQMESKRIATTSRGANVFAQLDVLKEEKKIAEKDLSRIEKMFKDKAATQKQLDDIRGRIEVLNKQMLAIESQNSPIVKEANAIDAQINQMKDLLRKCTVINPIDGVVLNKFAEQFEVTAPGKPLYKIADLKTLILRAYISGAQLSKIKIGSKVKVYADKDANSNKEYEGTVEWISSRAEFTPKIIQTKEERVKQVYAVKIRVPNDGSLKIGMPGEVRY